ncbi:hypothetical protein PMYN1_Chma330 (chromatophore) [Paulinella micropora]|uniref:VTT domain-containing protein n=1 Tax=Paulinella micropora TaxID=1928728 RepID=A0A1L5YBS2_9EUKA|nr:hypothetical protein PCKR_371 [Paulinella micropora]AQX44925.1 hypothetical protein PFK_371 [Paulinella micropora]BBL86139.1 hypothetical protein PMYN1_Chma330 [Paulinella micropora]
MLLYTFIDQIEPILHSIQGKLIFIIVYAVWVTLLLPGSPPTILAGFLYGAQEGTLIAFLGSSLGAEISFLLGRYLLQSWVQYHLARFPQAQFIERIINQADFRLVLLTRLSPLFPFSLLNMAYGVSKVSIRNYTLGLIGTLPGTLVLCQFASVAHTLKELYNSTPGQNNSYFVMVQVIGLLSTLILVGLVAQTGKLALLKSHENMK